MEEQKDELFDSKNAVKSNWVKFGKIGDFVKGTLVDVREMKSTFPGKEGQMVKIYEILATSGSFHEMDDNNLPIDPTIVIQKGDFWNVGGKTGIDSQMRNIKIGQIIGMRFDSEVAPKTKGLSATKVIKVYAGAMDPNFEGQTSLDQV